MGDGPGNDSLPGDAARDGSVDVATCPSVAQECADAATADLGCGTTQAPDVPLTDCYDAGGVVTVSCEADGSFTD